MRTLSMWQPWASLWCSGVKVHETRHWATKYRGPLLIHAAQYVERGLDPELVALVYRVFGVGPEAMTRGAIIGMVEVVDCLPIAGAGVNAAGPLAVPASDDDRLAGNWGPGRYALRAVKPERFGAPTPWRGRQNFFDVPATALLQGSRV